MAGSYGHVDPKNGGRWSLIENMGDAHECVEELLYLVRCFAPSENEIKKALKVFYQFERGEKDAQRALTTLALGEYARSYLEVKRVMEEAD